MYLARLFYSKKFMIKTKDLKYTYDGKTWLNFPDIKCQKNEMLLLLGQSGVGKTTLLHLIGGLMPSKSGSIIIGDTELQALTNTERDAFRGKNIGIIFQQAHFVRSVSCLDNLLLAQSLAGNRSDKNECLGFMEDLGIAHKAHQNTASLSQGEKQRLSIARALVNKPEVILADEPTSALDDVNTHQVVSLLKKEARIVNASLIIVTHDARLKKVIPNQITLSS